MSQTRERIFRKLLLQQKVKFKPQLREAAKKKTWNIVRGDTVQVIGNHPESGKQGIIKLVDRKKDRVLVEGVNMRPFTIRPDEERGIKGSIIQKERTIHYSKVNLVDPVTGGPTRIMKKFLDDGTKVRISKRSGAVIPKPEILKLRKPINLTVTDQCTTEDDGVWELTYDKEKEVHRDEIVK